eukprot:TRINITY_DN1303_c0_g1_i3.p1 TRINITY_DN1303_c0_g1~~TRINITY_DN1303_c0_g1_i3.p1  ORF type:complete len:893 (+),score=193.38 TRINITY_DN1303_c0_g1_i3:147-2825(+)
MQLIHYTKQPKVVLFYGSVLSTTDSWSISETFCFILTDSAGKKKYGYCLHFLPQANGPRLPRCLCLISSRPCNPVYNCLLMELEKRINLPFLTPNIMNCFLEVLKNIHDAPFPSPGQSLKFSSFSLARPLESDHVMEEEHFDSIVKTLKFGNILHIFSSLLMERRMIFTSLKLSTLSTFIQAFMSLLHPFEWQFVLIPVLPKDLLTFCCAPMPFIIGVLSQHLPLVMAMQDAMSEVFLYDIDKDEFILKPMDDFQLIVPIASSLQKNIDAITKAVKKNKPPEEGKPFHKQLAEAFLIFFLELFGGYRNYIPPQARFNQEKYLSAQPVASQPFLSKFLKVQMFESFMRERETRGDNCSGPFDHRILMLDQFENALVSTKSKKDVDTLRMAIAKMRGREVDELYSHHHQHQHESKYRGSSDSEEELSGGGQRSTQPSVVGTIKWSSSRSGKSSDDSGGEPLSRCINNPEKITWSKNKELEELLTCAELIKAQGLTDDTLWTRTAVSTVNAPRSNSEMTRGLSPHRQREEALASRVSPRSRTEDNPLLTLKSLRSISRGKIETNKSPQEKLFRESFAAPNESEASSSSSSSSSSDDKSSGLFVGMGMPKFLKANSSSSLLKNSSVNTNGSPTQHQFSPRSPLTSSPGRSTHQDTFTCLSSPATIWEQSSRPIRSESLSSVASEFSSSPLNSNNCRSNNSGMMIRSVSSGSDIDRHHPSSLLGSNRVTARSPSPHTREAISAMLPSRSASALSPSRYHQQTSEGASLDLAPFLRSHAKNIDSRGPSQNSPPSPTSSSSVPLSSLSLEPMSSNNLWAETHYRQDQSRNSQSEQPRARGESIIGVRSSHPSSRSPPSSSSCSPSPSHISSPSPSASDSLSPSASYSDSPSSFRLCVDK